MRYTLHYYRDDMGNFTQPGVTSVEDALWHVNNAREHDGLRPLKTLMEGYSFEVKMIPEYPSNYYGLGFLEDAARRGPRQRQQVAGRAFR